MTTSEGLVFTPRYADVIRSAESIARERGDGYVGVEHLMLAILANEDSVPTQELQSMGIEPDRIASALTATMDSDSFKAVRNRARFLDGRVVEHFPDGRIVTEHPDGTVTEHHE
ncbi:Clp protease N-terminal domain-containing protein [Nocardia sp. NPDC004604]|uniref:T-complex 10 C-terminal domain-containing protein n=1 Tax=Nocardia sp. NPDC004604 TaxID=3157013 RepID=UPI0033B713F5